MAAITKGQRLVCVPCGREIIVDACGISRATLWCCGKPMSEPAKKTCRPTAKKR